MTKMNLRAHRKEVSVLVDKMRNMKFSKDTIRQVLYVLACTKEEKAESIIYRTNEVLKENFDERIFWHKMSACMDEFMYRHSEEEKAEILKEVIRRRERR